MEKLALALALFDLAVKSYPPAAKATKELLESLKGNVPDDISREEFVSRIDAAIAGLPPWN